MILFQVSAERELKKLSPDELARIMSGFRWTSAREAALELLLSRGPRVSVPVLAKLVKSRRISFTGHMRIVEELGGMGKEAREATPVLKEILQSKRGEFPHLQRRKVFLLQEKVAWALGEIKDRKAIPALLYALKYNWSRGVSAASAESLAKLGALKAIEPLRRIIKSKGKGGPVIVPPSKQTVYEKEAGRIMQYAYNKLVNLLKQSKITKK